MKNSLFQQQANAVTSHVLEQIREDNEKLRDELKVSEQKMFSILEHLATTEKESTPQSTTPPLTDNESINSASQPSQTEMQKYFDAKFAALEKKYNKRKANNNGDGEEKKHSDGGGKKKARYRWNTSEYCWSCGAGNHPSSKCKKRKDGHKENATFTNMMGGCTDFCQVVPKS